jgi:hypothetical protein
MGTLIVGLGGGGGGAAGTFNTSNTAPTGLYNTGGGGGGGFGNLGTGGSGIVILRYPSYQTAARATTGGPQTYVTGPWRVYVFNASGTITF